MNGLNFVFLYYCQINHALSQFLHACFDLAYFGFLSTPLRGRLNIPQHNSRQKYALTLHSVYIILYYCCPINYALSQFLYACFDLACFGCRSVQRSTSRDKNMRQRAKMHTFFYKYVTSPRLLSFTEKKSIKFINYITS